MADPASAGGHHVRSLSPAVPAVLHIRAAAAAWPSSQEVRPPMLTERHPLRLHTAQHAVIDQLTQCGFAKAQIRKTINNLLQLYWKDGWVFLEEGSYHVVLAKLLEKQAQQDQDSIELAVSSKVKGAQVRYIQELEHKVQRASVADRAYDSQLL